MSRYDFGGGGYPPYVSVAEKRARAAKEAAKLARKGVKLSPVSIEGRTIARTFWGKQWCDNLDSYSDYASRLPRGRSYLTHGCVIDLQITQGRVTAKVRGTSLYTLSVTIQPLSPKRWNALKTRCSGSIDSMVELLQGRLSKSVMAAVVDRAEGLFPAPAEIKMSCSCPDWAGLCKHLAAALYGVGARLDTHPELLFTLRGVDPSELLSTGAIGAADAGAGDLAGADLGALFGIEMAPETTAPAGATTRAAKKAVKTATKVAAAATATKPTAKTRRAAKKKAPEPTPAAAPPAAKKRAKAAAIALESELAAFQRMLDGLGATKPATKTRRK